MKAKNSQLLPIITLAILCLFLLNACGGSKKTQKNESPKTTTTKPKPKPKPKPKTTTKPKPKADKTTTKPKPKTDETAPTDSTEVAVEEDAFSIGEEKDRWGEDSLKTVENYSLYREFFKQGAYTDAVPYWRYVYKNAPAARKTPLMNGEQMYKKMMEEQIEMAVCQDDTEVEIVDGKIKKSLCKKSVTGGFKEWKVKDPKKFKAIFDTILNIYNTRVKYFGERGYMTTKRVRLYDKYLPKEKKIINKLRETALEQEAEETSYDILYGYFKNQLVKLEAEEITALELVELYDNQLLGIVDYNIENNEKYAAKYQKYGDKMATKIEVLRNALAEQQEGFQKIEQHKVDSADYAQKTAAYEKALKANEEYEIANKEYEAAVKAEAEAAKAEAEFKAKMSDIEKQREAIAIAEKKQVEYKAFLAEQAKRKAKKEAQQKEYEEKLAALTENDEARKEYEKKLAELKKGEAANEKYLNEQKIANEKYIAEQKVKQDAYLAKQKEGEDEYEKQQKEYQDQLAAYEKVKAENQKRILEAQKKAEEAQRIAILTQKNAPKKVAAPTAAPKASRAAIKPVSSCAEAKERYNEGDPNDERNVKNLVSRLQRLQCKSDPMFIKSLEKLHELDPTASRARVIAQYYFYEKKNSSKAITYYEKAIKLEKDRTKNAKVYMSLAVIERRKSSELTNASAKKARQYAKKAAELNPGWGKPYMFIGNLYASSGPLCGTGRGWKSQVVTWPATDMWEKAKSIDPAFSDEANKAIANYAQYYPTVEDGFMNGGVKQGASFKIPCWINVTTRARLRKE